MSLFAGVRGLWLIVLALIAPTIVVLGWLAFRFTASLRERLTNLLLGFIFAVGAIFALDVSFDPRPNSWAEQNDGLLLFAIAPVGAALGLAVAVAGRYLASCRRRSRAH